MIFQETFEQKNEDGARGLRRKVDIMRGDKRPVMWLSRSKSYRKGIVLQKAVMEVEDNEENENRRKDKEEVWSWQWESYLRIDKIF